jgi:hypothetical protein
MRRQELSPAASRRGDRINVCRIAALLSALIVLTAVHRTQAQHAPDASWINPRASTPKEDLRLRYVDGRNTGVSKISSAAGSDDTRCEMSPEEFHKLYPPLIEWIRKMLDANAHVAQTVSSRGFSRLPHYFTKHTLVSTKVVIVDPLSVPPLASMGLTRFAGHNPKTKTCTFMNLFTLFNGACSDQIAFCWRTRMAWNALAIGRVRWKLWRMMPNQSSLALRLFSTQKSWSQRSSACKSDPICNCIALSNTLRIRQVLVS